jgi:hypothetical protein
MPAFKVERTPKVMTLDGLLIAASFVLPEFFDWGSGDERLD